MAFFLALSSPSDAFTMILKIFPLQILHRGSARHAVISATVEGTNVGRMPIFWANALLVSLETVSSDICFSGITNARFATGLEAVVMLDLHHVWRRRKLEVSKQRGCINRIVTPDDCDQGVPSNC
ncbi:hypothetical protein DIC66_17785 [Rhodoferax lacus]|uniref:Uncharacterized protein n=1 Tax=Rhodoferax lacus TaxID=2184758 RepID=A0A3E1R7Y4_9BURK|nr:hypothetical protein DIC66_17785 [Rhodoferax lacus]